MCDAYIKVLQGKNATFSCCWLKYCLSVQGGPAPGGGAVPACQPHLEQTQWDGNDEWLGGGMGGWGTQIIRDTLASIKNVLNLPTDPTVSLSHHVK